METAQKTLQVLLSSLKENPTDGTFRGYLLTMEGDTLLEIMSNSRSDSRVLDILQQVVSLSRAKNRRSMRSVCFLSRLPGNFEDTFDPVFRLCCKILIKDAKDLLDGLPFNRKNIFDRCMTAGSARTYESWKPMDFYEHVHTPSAGKTPLENQSAIRPLEKLQCQLYPFQKRALQWLLWREGVGILETPPFRSIPS